MADGSTREGNESLLPLGGYGAEWARTEARFGFVQPTRDCTAEGIVLIDPTEESST